MALGLSDYAAPATVFVLVGVVLGPAVLDVLSGSVLAQLDPAVSVALAVLGVFVGSGYAAARRRSDARSLAGAAAETSVTIACVAGAMYLLLSQWAPILPLIPATAAIVFGTCAAASAALRVDPETPPQVTAAAHIADIDDLPLVVAGAIAVPLLARLAQPEVAIGLTVLLGLVVGGAGTLLFERAVSPPERLVFVTGTVVLLGGAAAYSSASPLATGFVAGLLWTLGPFSTVSLVESDLRKLQHPLVAILLVIAGASVQFSSLLLWISAPLVLCRLTGKLLGSLIAARLLAVPAGLLATIVVSPGVLGIALALNIQQVLGTGDTILVSAVTTLVVASELVTLALLSDEAS